ncbi:MAG: NAD-dependent epimerase/dehydratase family protein [Betaproteobacteria bacterium]
MKILIVGASGYLGGALARAWRDDGHDVAGVVRSDASAAKLLMDGLGVVRGDLRDPVDLATAVTVATPDAVIVAASAGGGAGDTAAFTADRDAVQVLAAALAGKGKTLVFTSGSAVFGVFAGGECAGPAFTEDTVLPLPPSVFARGVGDAEAKFADDLEQAVGARIDAEEATLRASGIRGMVVRPGNIYGYGGSVDIPKAIEIARANGVAPQWGRGLSLQGYVHLDDVVALYRRVLLYGRAGGVYHAVTEEVSQHDLGRTISRAIGAGDRTQSVTLTRMNDLAGTRGVRLSLNKRLSAAATSSALGWSPRRIGVLTEIEFGSYASATI